MPVSVLELQRARKLLQAFCSDHNRIASGDRRLACLEKGDALYLVAAKTSTPLVRLSWRGDHWQLSWPRADGGWEPWAPRPRAERIEDVIAELQQAPLHVHWG